MKAGNDWSNLEHAVDRHEAVVIEEATAIPQLRREIALIIEALEKIELFNFLELENHPQAEGVRDRYREIVEQLKASHATQVAAPQESRGPFNLNAPDLCLLGTREATDDYPNP
jgi:hypothetical protein